MARELEIKISVDQALAQRALKELDGEVEKLTQRFKAGDLTLKQYEERLKILSETESEVRAKAADLGKAHEKQTDSTMGLAGAVGSLVKIMSAYVSADVIIRAIKASFEYASSLERMEAATNISTTGLQKLENVAAATSVPFEALTNGVLDLQRRLSTGDNSAAAAFAKLRINVQDFIALHGDEQLRQLARQLGNMADETERNRLAFEIFGRSYKDILPALTTQWDDLAGAVHTANEDQLKEMAKVEQQWSQLILGAKRYVLEVVAGLEEVTKAHIAAAAKISGLKWYSGFLGPDQPTPPMAPPIPTPEPAGPVTPSGAAYLTLKQFMIDAEVETKRLEREQALLLETIKKNDEAAKKYGEAIGELNTAGQGWRGTLETIDGAVVEGIKWYLEAGVSQAALATAYALTATQIKSVASALVAEKDAWTVEQESLRQTGELWNQYFAMRIEHGGTTLATQKAQIAQWAANEVAQLKDADLNWQQHYDAIQLVAGEKLRGISVDWDTYAQHSKQSLEDTAATATATYEEMRAHSENFTSATIEHFRQIADTAQQAALNWQETFDKALDHTAEKSKAVAQGMKSDWAFLGGVIVGDITGSFPGGVGRDAFGRPVTPGWLGHKASGGPVAGNRPYMVGEGGPELFVPHSSGTIIPNGAGGGISISVVVEGNIDSELTARRFADQTAAKIMTRLNQHRQSTLGKA